jgi:hypothetical protein
MKRSLAFLATVVVLGACRGGSSPTGPSSTASDRAGTPAATLLTFLSGETHDPVAGASVVVQGRTYVSDADGRVRLEQAAGDSAVVDAVASPFLERRTLLRGDRFTLWPKESPIGLDENYTARFVYNCPAAPCGAGERMLRVEAGQVWVVVSPELKADPEALRSHESAAALLTQATGGAVAFSLTDSPPRTGVVVRTYVDPNDADVVSRNAAAVTRRELGAQWNVTGASIVIRSVELARFVPLMLHEMGHVFGLGHSPRVGDVMWPGRELYETTDFAPPERLIIGLMLQRSPGNRYPDEDTGLVAGSGGHHTSVVVCGAPSPR